MGASMGLEPKNTTPKAFGDYIHSEIPKWSKVVRESGAGIN